LPTWRHGCAAVIASAVFALAAPAFADGGSAARTFDWTGFYLGGAVGYGTSRITYYDPAFPAWSLSHDPHGFVGGVRGGYNRQFGSVVAGIEGEILKSGVSGGVTDTQPDFAGDRFDADVTWIGLLAGRLGYACGPFLLFGRGGAAWARNELRYQYAQIPGFGPTQLNLTRMGWMLGAGVEYAIDRNWSASANYSYIGFGRTGDETFQPLPDGFVAQVSQSIQLVTVGLNYRFGP
jgi:outer membrane immunogenic protein